MRRLPLAQGLPPVAAGGALGAALRWGVTELWPVAGDGFPWPIFLVNVVGSAVLAALPALPAVTRSPRLPLFLGTGLLGGFTTMSTASEQTVQLLSSPGGSTTGLLYVAGTLVAAITAVWLVDRFTSPGSRALFAAEEGDE